MTKPIRRVGVVGAGVMGSGIAAHLANAGIEVLLLDIVNPKLEGDALKDRKQRNAFADGGLKKALKSKPAAFFHKSNALLVKTGNTEDDLDRLFRALDEAFVDLADAARETVSSSSSRL